MSITKDDLVQPEAGIFVTSGGDRFIINEISKIAIYKSGAKSRAKVHGKHAVIKSGLNWTTQDTENAVKNCITLEQL